MLPAPPCNSKSLLKSLGILIVISLDVDLLKNPKFIEEFKPCSLMLRVFPITSIVVLSTKELDPLQVIVKSELSTELIFTLEAWISISIFYIFHRNGFGYVFIIGG